jgi:hypothetical protein
MIGMLLLINMRGAFLRFDGAGHDERFKIDHVCLLRKPVAGGGGAHSAMARPRQERLQ